MSNFLLQSYNLVCRRNGRALFAPVRLALCEGEIVHLKSPNGSGKTSLLRALAGLLPFEGQIEKQAAHTYIGHRNAVQGELTVCEHFHFWQGLAQNRRVIFFDDVLDAAGLQGMEDRRASTLSEGQRQRLALCRLLIEDAPLWLLDEPTSALDADGHNFFASLLEKHTAQGGAAFIASHSEALPNATLFHLNRAAA